METTLESPARLGVMGGTFDPIHVGHLVAASEVLFRFRLDLVLFVPTGQPWQKQSYSAAEDRYLMTVLGIASNTRFAASRMEIDRRGPTYTADTMEALRDFHGEDVELFFIAGADAAMHLSTWRKIARLAELAEVIAVTRPGFRLERVEAGPAMPEVHVLDMPAIGVSSSEIRERVATGQPIEYMVPDEVARYIRKNGLYVGDARW
ncbi:MAG: nicotinate-nucleotide adenylyltransferase [Actinomycetota bacterium]